MDRLTEFGSKIDFFALEVQRIVEAPQVQSVDKIVDVPVVMQRQFPIIQTVQKTVDFMRNAFAAKVLALVIPPVNGAAGKTSSLHFDLQGHHGVGEVYHRVARNFHSYAGVHAQFIVSKLRVGGVAMQTSP